MNPVSVILRTAWKLIFVLNFVAGLLVLYPFFYILLSKEKWFPKAFVLMKFWARWILIVPGVFVRKTNAGLLNIPTPCVYCANHSSYLDIVASYIIIPNYFVFMGKQELDKAPLFRIFFKKMNILVNRKNKMRAYQAFVEAEKHIDQGHGVFLFPEGTISKDGILKEFKNGPFKLAIDKQVPIIPITFLNNWKLLQNGGLFKSNGRPGISNVVIHEPIYTAGMTEANLADLRTSIYNIIRSDLAAADSSN